MRNEALTALILHRRRGYPLTHLHAHIHIVPPDQKSRPRILTQLASRASRMQTSPQTDPTPLPPTPRLRLTSASSGNASTVGVVTPADFVLDMRKLRGYGRLSAWDVRVNKIKKSVTKKSRRVYDGKLRGVSGGAGWVHAVSGGGRTRSRAARRRWRRLRKS